MATDNIHTPCPYITIGADITITHSPPTASSFDLLDNVISSLTATADKHLQKFKQRKNMHSNKQDNEANIIDEDVVIGELVKANMVLLPFAINPHGRWGSILQHFLSLSDKTLDYNFPQHQPNAQNMFTISTTHPCPIGILWIADSIWKSNKMQQFFGYSYSSPTPSIYTIQQLGLGITKAFMAHIRNTTHLLTTSPSTRQHSTEGPRQSALFLANWALE
jgi:hypothetical protein